MKTLSIKQPWSWLIVHGGKDIENRTWNTKFRGEFLVHASKTIDWASYNRLIFLGVKVPQPENFKRGGIIGKVELIDVVDHSDSIWFEGPVGFVLKNPVALPFKACKGQLGFFDLEWEK